MPAAALSAPPPATTSPSSRERSNGLTQPTVDLGELLGLSLRAPFQAPTRRVAKGPLTMPADHQLCIVASGAVLRRVRIGHRAASTLLGPGDVLVADPPGHEPFEVEAHALTRSSFVLVDRRFPSRNIAVAVALLQALDTDSMRCGYQHALAQFVSLEDRLEWLLPMLADRWGIVTSAGIVLPAFLTHTVMSELLGARRPSFTTAMARLQAAGTLARLADGRWQLGPARRA